jgi:trehalose 6-phosphate phosphatase
MGNSANKYSFKTVIFDLDGVVTKTALVHAAAWKEAFDEYLRLREKRDGEPFREFTHQDDYLPYVDGKPRYKGVQSFLEARGIHIPFGDPSDLPGKETICGIGNRKNEKYNQELKAKGAQIFPSTVELIRSLKKAGVRIGVASSSKNCKTILESVNLEDLFETRVDGEVSALMGLHGKPEADIFVTATLNLGVLPAESIVVEDATSGVLAGRNGGFGLVLGIARENNEAELLENGADVVVTDLAQISIEEMEEWFHRSPRSLSKAWDTPSALPQDEKAIVNPYYGRSAKSAFFTKKKLVFFLDYDGTLTPIVSHPELAVLSKEMREVVKKLSQEYTTAIVSGRMRQDVQNLVGIEGLFYAGSHGFDINGPNFSMVKPEVEKLVPLIAQIVEKLNKELGSIKGILIEDKKFSVGVHYRLVDEQRVPQIKAFCEVIIKSNTSLRLMEGKKVFEIMPAIYWNKGEAVRWIMQALKIEWAETSVVYIGDDTTDENAFRVVRTRGAGILVSEKPKISCADYLLSSPQEVRRLFEQLI